MRIDCILCPSICFCDLVRKVTKINPKVSYICEVYRISGIMVILLVTLFDISIMLEIPDKPDLFDFPGLA